jgi:hypothetical protein
MEAFKAGTAPGEANAPTATADDGATGTASATPGAPPSTVGEGTGGLY